ncbi:MAG: peptide MFS transporter [Phycisphaerae bacterium]|nr:peptide MFS transporter [Phycisphaerae bacterium]
METAARREFLGHPVGLFVLFFTELWERFSFYSLRAFLVLYMTKAMLLSGKMSNEIYGAYLGFVYAAPFVGGMLADRLLGQRIAIYIGGALLALSQFMLATHAFMNAQQADLSPGAMNALFFGALAVLSAGNGFFKPNISTIVGSLYSRTDARRDGAFTIFYMGINIGSFSAGFSGQIAENFGWYWGFLIAGVGMIISLIIFRACRDSLQGQGLAPRPEALHTPGWGGLPKPLLLATAVLAYIVLAGWLISNPGLLQGFAPFVAIPVVIYLIWEAARGPRDEAGRIAVILVLCAFVMFFWAFFDLHGSMWNLFADQRVDRVVPFLSSIVPPSGELRASLLTASTNGAMIILLAIPFSRLWVWLNRRRMEPSSPLKFALGLAQLAAGYYVMYHAALVAGPDGKCSLWWLFLAFLLHTTGELCISPVGLSTITKMSPPRLVGTFMGVWFLSPAIGHVFGGKVAGLTDAHGFATVFWWITLASLGAAALLLLLVPLLNRLARVPPTAAH